MRKRFNMKFYLFLLLGITALALASCSPVESPTLNCTENQTEVDGVCVDDEVEPTTCDPAKILVGDSCVEPPTCGPDEMIVEGVCEPKPVECSEGEVEVDGECESVCEADEEWVDGECEPIPKVCTFPQEPIDGDCVDVPILDVTFTHEEAEADFDQAIRFLNDNNPKYFLDEEELEEVINTQRALLYEGISYWELRQVIGPIVATYDCGHTYLSYGDFGWARIDVEQLYFPITTRFIDLELFVYEDVFYSSIEPGSKILSVNGHTIEEILEVLEYDFPTEGNNLTSLYYYLNYNFRYAYTIAIDKSTSFTIEYVEYTTGEIKEVTVEGKTYDEIDQVEVFPVFEHFSEVYEDDYAIMTVNTFQYWGDVTRSDYIEFYEEFFTEVESRGINSIIIDVRHNGGGLSSMARELFSYIAIESEPYETNATADVPFNEPHFDGDVYTLISGGSFSATGFFVAKIESQGIGVLIGEETHSSYITQGSSRTFTLAHSRMELKIGTVKTEAVVTDIEIGRGIIPDHEVHMTIEDYLAGVDTIMEYTIDLIEQNNAE